MDPSFSVKTFEGVTLREKCRHKQQDYCCKEEREGLIYQTNEAGIEAENHC